MRAGISDQTWSSQVRVSFANHTQDFGSPVGKPTEKPTTYFRSTKNEANNFRTTFTFRSLLEESA